MRRLLAALAMGALLIGVFAAPAAATRGTAVPIEMQVVGLDEPLQYAPGFPFVWDTFDGRCSVPSSWVTTIDSSGWADHLGKVSVSQSHCTQYDVFDPSPLTHRVFTNGSMTVVGPRTTGPKGDPHPVDTLVIEYSGYFLFTATGEATGVSDLHYDSMTIVGGTGRFKGASGTLHGQATDIFPTGPNTAHFWGWIVYDPSVGPQK